MMTWTKAVSGRALAFLAPSTFWIVVLLLGLGALVAAGGYTVARIARDEAVRRSEVNARIAQCLASRKLIRELDEHVAGVTYFTSVQVRNAAMQLEATPRGTAIYAVRFENLARLSHAQKKVAALRGLPVPTPQQCRNQPMVR